MAALMMRHVAVVSLLGSCTSAAAPRSRQNGTSERSPGCGLEPPYDPRVQRLSQRINLQGRWYLLALPAGTQAGGGVVYDKDTPHPLIVNFHGMGMGPRAEQSWSGLTPLANRRGVISVYPAGMGDCSGSECYTSWNGGGTASGRSPDSQPTCTNVTEPYWANYNSCLEQGLGNVPEGTMNPPCNIAPCVDDVAWASAVLDHLESTLCVDTSRVQVTGSSIGGIFAMQIGASLAHRVSSVVPITSVPLRGYSRELVPTIAGQGVNVMSIVGNLDQVMPRDGGESYEGFLYDSQQDWTDAWANYHGALPGPSGSYETPGEPGEPRWRDLRCMAYEWADGPTPPLGAGMIVRCDLNIGHNGEQRTYAPELKYQFLIDFPRPRV